MPDVGQMPASLTRQLSREMLYKLQEIRLVLNEDRLRTIPEAIEGNLVAFDNTGNIVDSGKAPPDGVIVGTTDTQSLSNKTLLIPVIADLSSAQHNHKSAQGGGDYSWADLVAADVVYLHALVGDIVQTNLVDKSANEDITGAWRLAKMPHSTYTQTNATLTSDDWGKLIIMDNGTKSVFVYLPSIGATDIGCPLCVVRLGSGRVTIQAADADVLENSSAGGAVFCEEASRGAANLWLRVVSATKYMFEQGCGIWKTI